MAVSGLNAHFANQDRETSEKRSRIVLAFPQKLSSRPLS